MKQMNHHHNTQYMQWRKEKSIQMNQVKGQSRARKPCQLCSSLFPCWPEQRLASLASFSPASRESTAAAALLLLHPAQGVRVYPGGRVPGSSRLPRWRIAWSLPSPCLACPLQPLVPGPCPWLPPETQQTAWEASNWLETAKIRLNMANIFD